MAISDGWVGEHHSSDHTVIPDLSDRSEPAFVAGPAPILVEPRSGSGIGRVLAGAVTLAVFAVGAMLGWPSISAMLDEEADAPLSLALSSEPTQRLVISGGSIYLEGSVPDENTSKFIEAAAQKALGADRVINNFEISDRAIFDPSKPVVLSVAETVLFPSGQARVKKEYEPLIDLAVELMRSQPNTILTIVGHTDAQGPEDVNLQLSVDRANAVAAEIERHGVDSSRLSVDGRGEAEPNMTNETSEGRSANRRVEFLISGLLD